MEKPKRNPRTIAMEKNQQKPSGEPAFDRNTGAPCPQDQVKGSYNQWTGEGGSNNDENDE